ncbi:unnamed protein product, partial [marine sediment metagenome]
YELNKFIQVAPRAQANIVILLLSKLVPNQILIQNDEFTGLFHRILDLIK